MNQLTKNQKIFIIIFILIIIILLLYTLWNFYQDEDTVDYEFEDLMVNTNISNNELSNAIEASSEKIIVYIIGSVKNPGIVELTVDSRVSDAVDLAGGLLEDADISKINLAYKLEDRTKNNNSKYSWYIW